MFLHMHYFRYKYELCLRFRFYICFCLKFTILFVPCYGEFFYIQMSNFRAINALLFNHPSNFFFKWRNQMFVTQMIIYRFYFLLYFDKYLLEVWIAKINYWIIYQRIPAYVYYQLENVSRNIFHVSKLLFCLFHIISWMYVISNN
jgi:hypothetical protein